MTGQGCSSDCRSSLDEISRRIEPVERMTKLLARALEQGIIRARWFLRSVVRKLDTGNVLTGVDENGLSFKQIWKSRDLG